MRKLLLTVVTAGFVFAPALTAQQPADAAADLRSAVVYFNGAELTHEARTSLKRGENEIRITGLSPAIDPQSLKIHATGGVTVTANEFSIDYLSRERTPTRAMRILEDSVSIYEELVADLRNQVQINRDMTQFLKQGISKNVSGSEQGLDIDQLVKTMDYYKDKAAELDVAGRELDRRRIEAERTLIRLRTQRDQEKSEFDRTSGVVRLTVNAPVATASTITVRYFTPQASWSPYYDVNIASVEAPVEINMKARVRQTTGLDWDRVRLTLSGAVPSNGRVAPLFSAWFLAPVVARPAVRMDKTAAMQNRYSYEESYAVEEVAVSAYSGGYALTEPYIFINGVASSEWDLANIDHSDIRSVDTLTPDQVMSRYGINAPAGAIEIILKEGMQDYVTTAENDLNVLYEIDLPYSVPGNGKMQNIDLGSREARAEFKYYSAPKLDTETYLLAEIENWESLGLMSGPANITYDGNYIGEARIEASATGSRLSLTLGTDPRIAVKRETVRDFSGSRTSGGDVTQTFAYQITVRNNRTVPVKMVVKDQYPISTRKEITVNLLSDTTPWTANVEELGVITWEETFAPGETKTYRVAYSVKYPRGTNLNL